MGTIAVGLILFAIIMFALWVADRVERHDHNESGIQDSGNGHPTSRS